MSIAFDNFFNQKIVIRFKLKQQIADLEFREKRRVTIQEIADATGVNRMTLSKMVNQHGAIIRTDVLDRLCEYFGCQVGDLAEYMPTDRQKD
jgi:putative transcriptional regulator